MTENRGWNLERYQPGAETQIVPLFNDVFKQRRTLEYWRWRFEKNPYHAPIASLARSTEGKLVGQYSVMPCKLNVAGSAVLACQSLDTLVHPEFRMRGIFEETARDCYEQCRAAGFQAIIGFPNANSFPGFMRRLGWHRMGFLDRYELRLGFGRGQGWARRLLRRSASVLRSPAVAASFARRSTVERRRTSSRLTSNVASDLPDDYEPLWQTVRSQEVLSVWKDAEYLQWRYGQNPNHSFLYVSVRSPHHLEALLVVTASSAGHDATICEVLVRDFNVVAARTAVATLLEVLSRRGVAWVRFRGMTQGLFREIFSGFVHSTGFDVVLCGRPLAEAPFAQAFPLAQNWTVTFGDTDSL